MSVRQLEDHQLPMTEHAVGYINNQPFGYRVLGSNFLRQIVDVLTSPAVKKVDLWLKLTAAAIKGARSSSHDKSVWVTLDPRVDGTMSEEPTMTIIFDSSDINRPTFPELTREELTVPSRYEIQARICGRELDQYANCLLLAFDLNAAAGPQRVTVIDTNCSSVVALANGKRQLVRHDEDTTSDSSLTFEERAKQYALTYLVTEPRLKAEMLAMLKSQIEAKVYADCRAKFEADDVKMRLLRDEIRAEMKLTMIAEANLLNCISLPTYEEAKLTHFLDPMSANVPVNQLLKIQQFVNKP